VSAPESLRLVALSALLLGLAALGSGCMLSVDDPYSKVKPFCSDPDPWVGRSQADGFPTTYLSAECKKALESVIPYDASLDKAPTGFKDKITEAFQALVAYPIAVPLDNTLFGASPARAGAIPYSFIKLLQEERWENPNQALFNYILDRVGKFSYQEESPDGHDAQYSFRTITLFRDVWDPEKDKSDRMRNPFNRIALLVHESRHGEGHLSHVECEDKERPAASSDSEESTRHGKQCDSELDGPYGFGILYLKSVLHGSGTCEEESPGAGCVPILFPASVQKIGEEMCNMIQNKINHPFAELQETIKNVDCESLTAEDVRALEEVKHFEYPKE
jgi:hypothetical protein